MAKPTSKGSFFRQSGWLVVATVLSGVFMSAVHPVVSRFDEAEFASFTTLLRVFLLLGIPAGGLQIVFAQQAAAALDETRKAAVAAATRDVLRGTFVIWAVTAAATLVWQEPILRVLKIRNPAALWFTILLGLASLWMPLWRGLLQGNERFAGLGWVLVLDGVGRLLGIAAIVHYGGQAAGAMGGALIGQLVAFAVGAWLTAEFWMRKGSGFEWGPWLRRVTPLTLGVGTVLFMTTVDGVFAQAVFPKQTVALLYMPAATIGVALVTLTTPITAVMFPKIVQSTATKGTTNALMQGLAATAALVAGAALAATLLPELPLRILYFRNNLLWQAAPLVPCFAWALAPLIMANVLIGNMLARERFAAVPWLVLVAVGYSGALAWLRGRLPGLEPLTACKWVIGTLGASNLVLLAVACGFTFFDRTKDGKTSAVRPG